MTNGFISKDKRILGCLLGGAVGDALGAPVEFSSRNDILRRFPNGVDDYIEFADGWGRVTDDTQMTLFTAEALLETQKRIDEGRPFGDAMEPFAESYLHWLHTQYPYIPSSRLSNCGELVNLPELNSIRAPGTTCLSSLERLKIEGKWGTPEKPLNNSKGCGTVMRVSPIGLIPSLFARAFELGARSSATTHGHSSGWLAGGAASLLISFLFQGEELTDSVRRVLERLEREKGGEEVVDALNQAIEFSDSLLDDAEAIDKIGGGWVAEEALAIAVFCSLRHCDDFRGAVCAAINISGDSDSTGAITGNILGCYLGLDAIPSRWLERLREREIVESVARRLCDAGSK